MFESKSLDSKERKIKRKKRTNLIKKFGINADQYEAMFVEQNGVCAICRKLEICNRDLCVDHCHTSNRVRGLLCTNCNMALGKFQDSIEYLQNAVEYLKREYAVPEIEDSIVKINHNDRPNWKMLVTTPDGLFPSFQHAANFYKVHNTTIRCWCMPGNKWKKEGFSCEKMHISLTQLKEYIDVKNQGC